MTRWVHPAWGTLGIDPTSDTRAIRTAYSAKLKAIDPDTDPAAFIELREAFEAAKFQAQWVDEQDDEEDEDEEAYDYDAWEEPAPEYHIRPLAHAADPAEPPALADEAPGPASPWAPIRPADADAHAHALVTLLHSNDRTRNPYPSDAQTEEMLAHWRAIAGDPRMQEIAFFADADRWCSELIARTVPFSDPLVLPATRHFGWARSDGAITQSWAVAQVTARARMLEFLDAVKAPAHPLNPAWRELTTAATERSRRGRANGRRVRQLLRIVRDKYPDMEGCFDSMRVALWDGTGSEGGTRVRWVIPGIFIAIVIIRLLSYLGGGTLPDSRPPLTPELTAPAPDIDRALDAFFGPGKLNLATIEKRNPKLHRALLDYWAEERPRFVTRSGFATDIGIFLTGWYFDGVWRGDPAILADFHTLSIDIAKALRTTDPAACRKFLQSDRLWSGRLSLGPAFRERQNALVLRAALANDGSKARDTATRFNVPGDVVTAAAARARMNRDALSAAMLFEGSDANQCTGRIAFMETVLALPAKRGLPIMRHM
jgi:hypothetical protein